MTNDKCQMADDKGAGKGLPYADEELLRLLAEPGLSNAQIAKRLGVSRQCIGRIVRGESRQDLKDKIQPLMGARPTGGPRHRKKAYDDEQLVRLLTETELSCTEIARRVGISQGTMSKITLGAWRRDLWPRIREAVEARRLRRASQQRQYDDDELVRLLADPSKTYRQIAAEVGLGEPTVSQIARGELRPDLTERIRQATGGVRRGRPQRDYDDEKLVMLIAYGNKSYTQIGEAVGLSGRQVGMIARGQIRPDLQPRIRAASQEHLDQTRRLAARMALAVISRIFNLSDPDGRAPAKVQLEAGEAILRYALGDPGKTDIIVAQQNTTDVAGVEQADVAKFYSYLSERAKWERGNAQCQMPNDKREEGGEDK